MSTHGALDWRFGKNARRAAKRAEEDERYQLELETQQKEERRRANLSMYERISEANIDDDVKEILHMLAEKIGIDEQI